MGKFTKHRVYFKWRVSIKAFLYKQLQIKWHMGQAPVTRQLAVIGTASWDFDLQLHIMVFTSVCYRDSNVWYEWCRNGYVSNLTPNFPTMHHNQVQV